MQAWNGCSGLQAGVWLLHFICVSAAGICESRDPWLLSAVLAYLVLTRAAGRGIKDGSNHHPAPRASPPTPGPPQCYRPDTAALLHGSRRRPPSSHLRVSAAGRGVRGCRPQLAPCPAGAPGAGQSLGFGAAGKKRRSGVIVVIIVVVVVIVVGRPGHRLTLPAAGS